MQQKEALSAAASAGGAGGDGSGGREADWELVQQIEQRIREVGQPVLLGNGQ